MTAPTGSKPPERTREQGAQTKLSAGTGQPDSSRCLSINVTDGPENIAGGRRVKHRNQKLFMEKKMMWCERTKH